MMNSQRHTQLALFCALLSATREAAAFAPPQSTTFRRTQNLHQTDEEQLNQRQRPRRSDNSAFSTSTTTLDAFAASSNYFQNAAANAASPSDYLNTLSQIADYSYSSFGHSLNRAVASNGFEGASFTTGGVDGVNYWDWNAGEFLTDLSQQLMDAQQQQQQLQQQVDFHMPDTSHMNLHVDVPSMPHMPHVEMPDMKVPSMPHDLPHMPNIPNMPHMPNGLPDMSFLESKLPDMSELPHFQTRMPEMPHFQTRMPEGIVRFEEQMEETLGGGDIAKKLPNGEMLQHGWVFNSDANLANEGVKIGMIENDGGSMIANGAASAAAGAGNAVDAAFAAVAVDAATSSSPSSSFGKEVVADAVTSTNTDDGILEQLLTITQESGKDLDSEKVLQMYEARASEMADYLSSELMMANDMHYDSLAASTGENNANNVQVEDVTSDYNSGSEPSQMTMMASGEQESPLMASETVEEVASESVSDVSESMSNEMMASSDTSSSLDQGDYMASTTESASNNADLDSSQTMMAVSQDSSLTGSEAGEEFAKDQNDAMASSTESTSSDVSETMNNKLYASSEGMEDSSPNSASDTMSNQLDSSSVEETSSINQDAFSTPGQDSSNDNLFASTQGVDEKADFNDFTGSTNSFEKSSIDSGDYSSTQLKASTDGVEGSGSADIADSSNNQLLASTKGIEENSVNDQNSYQTDYERAEEINSHESGESMSHRLQASTDGFDDSGSNDDADAISNQYQASTEGLDGASDNADSVTNKLQASTAGVDESGSGDASDALSNQYEVDAKRTDDISNSNDSNSMSNQLRASTESVDQNAGRDVSTVASNQYQTPVEDSEDFFRDYDSSQIYVPAEGADESSTSDFFRDYDSSQLHASTGGMDENADGGYDNSMTNLLQASTDGTGQNNQMQDSSNGIDNSGANGLTDSASTQIYASTDGVDEGASDDFFSSSQMYASNEGVDENQGSDSLGNQFYEPSAQEAPPVDQETFGVTKYSSFGNVVEETNQATDSVQSQLYSSAKDSVSIDLGSASDFIEDSASSAADAVSSHLQASTIDASAEEVIKSTSAADATNSLSFQLPDLSYGSFVDGANAGAADSGKASVLSEFAADPSVSINHAFAFVRDKASAASSSLSDSFSTKLSSMQGSGTSLNDALASASDAGKSKLNSLFGAASKVQDASISSLNVINKAAVENKVAHSGAFIRKSVDLSSSSAFVPGSVDGNKAAAAFVGAPDYSFSRIGEHNLAECADGVVAGVKFLGGIVAQLLDIFLDAFAGTSLEQVLLSAQNSVHTLVDGATHSVISTINNVGSMSVAEVLQNFVFLVIAVSKILMTVVNAVVKLLSGKDATEWALVATATMNEQAHTLANQASVTVNDLSHRSFAELTASIAEFSQNVGHEVVDIAGSINDGAIPADVGEKLSSILTALQTSL